MSLRIVEAETNARLWDACLERWLSALGDRRGPAPHAARLWVAHRAQRDAALAAAADCGLPGWFDPPIHFLSELRRLFDIRTRPIGVLTARLLLARLAREHGDAEGLPRPGGGRGIVRSHMLDGLFGELLSEGVDPKDLSAGLRALPADAFTRGRNDWLVRTYREFLRTLETQDRYDARQIHALVAERIERGGLPGAVGEAKALHIYGITSLRRRRRLFRALADQADVEVTVYLLSEPEASGWRGFARDVERLEDTPPREPAVQPVPDSRREAAFVARRVKRLIVEDGCPPPRIAVVARSGRDDTWRVHRALEAAGVPSTARLRTPLSEIPALRALLDLFRGVATDWDYRGLRTVGTSPYLDLGLDPRPLDLLSSERRITGLDEWRRALERLTSAGDRRRKRHAGDPGSALRTIDRLRERLSGLEGSRPEAAWIDFTRSLTAGRTFGFRRRVCRVVGDRYDVVRLDQRGVRTLDGLLAEWLELVGSGPPLTAAAWHDRLRRLLEANDLALSTPRHRGVQVLEAHEAALTPFRHVFVVHANDGEFPRTLALEAGGILTDAERRALRDAGLPLEVRTLALRRERALWRAVTAAADVTVTYRTATAAGAPLLPSLMVPDHAADSALPRTVTHDDEKAPVNRTQRLRRDVLEVRRLRRGDDRRDVAVADVHAVQHAVLGAFADELRSGALDGTVGLARRLGLEEPPLLGRDRPISERAHAWGGRLRDPAVREILEDRFGPDRVWSASQLEQYARRPFDYLLSRILRIEGREEAEEETTPLASGTVIHAVLEELHRRLLDTPAATFESGRERLGEVSATVFDRLEREAALWLGLPSLWRLARGHLEEAIAEFVEWDFEQLARKNARPIAVEVAFGRGERDPVRLSGTDLHGRAVELRLAGRIDRVDRLGVGEGGIRVVDYKLKGTPKTAGYDDGALLQSALYMRAWELLHGERPEEALFLSVLEPGTGSRSGLPADRVDAVLKFALSIPARVRAGLFEPVQAGSNYPPAAGQPGPELTRTTAGISSGHRFDNPAETADGG